MSGADISALVARGIIEPEELFVLLNATEQQNTSLKVLDCTFVLPGSGENPHHNYLKQRIGESGFFDIEKISDPQSDLPHMLPTQDSFTSQMAQLGINAGDFIVVYGQSGMVMGPARVWWTFRAFGHTRICVLNGGLPAWLREGYPVNTGLPEPPKRGSFVAEYAPQLVSNIADVKAAIQNEGRHIFDARSSERFSGHSPEPRPGMQSGHIPRSRNIPCLNLVDAATGKFKGVADIRQLFESQGYQSGDSVIASCGSGVTACVLALALFYIGEGSCAVYDGSWSEWGRSESGNPVGTLAT